MKHLLIIAIIVGVGYLFVTKTEMGTNLWESFQGNEQVAESISKPPGKKPENNDEEIKEILRLTRVIYDLEQRINSISSEFEIIQNNSYQDEQQGNNNQSMLADLENMKSKMENDKHMIKELRDQLSNYKSKNKDVTEIKSYYEKILIEKNVQLKELSESMKNLQELLNEKDKLIEEQSLTINEQTITIDKQQEEISRLSKKYVIIYSRKETKIEEIRNNNLTLEVKRKKIDLISDHPQESYSISEENESTLIEITHEDLFWNGNNYFIIKVRSASL